MVADAANLEGDAAHVADEAADVGEHLAEVFVTDFHAVTLYVEDDMDVVFCERASHDGCVCGWLSVAPSGLRRAVARCAWQHPVAAAALGKGCTHACGRVVLSGLC